MNKSEARKLMAALSIAKKYYMPEGGIRNEEETIVLCGGPTEPYLKVEDVQYIIQEFIDEESNFKRYEAK